MLSLHHNVISPVPLETLGIKEECQIIKRNNTKYSIEFLSKKIQHHTNSSILQTPNSIICNTLTYPLINN